MYGVEHYVYFSKKLQYLIKVTEKENIGNSVKNIDDLIHFGFFYDIGDPKKNIKKINKESIKDYKLSKSVFANFENEYFMVWSDYLCKFNSVQ